MALKDILNYIPEVKHPVEKKLSFNKKLTWTIIILSTFFILTKSKIKIAIIIKTENKKR